MTERVLSYPVNVPRLPGRVRQGAGAPELHPALLALGAAASALACGYLVSLGYGLLMIAGLVGLAAVMLVLARPDLALLVWIGVLLAWGRHFTHLGVGQLYITEGFLALMSMAIGVRLLLSTTPKPGVKLMFGLAGLLWVPAIAGVALKTDLSNFDWTYEFAIIVYSLFAVVGAVVYHMPGFRRRLVITVLIGATVGLILPLADGDSIVTNTGAVRLIPGQYSIGYAAAILLILAAVRERLVRRLALLGTLPFLFGLIVVNHRSAWLGFAGAVTLLLASRPTASSRLTLVAGALCMAVVTTTTYVVSPTSTVGDSIARARASDTSDPNAEYRLAFWEPAVQASIDSPLIGSGFDRFPPEFVPYTTIAFEEDHPAPHNSWVALTYRIGPIFSLFLAGGLAWLIARGTRFARLARDRGRRVTLGALTTTVVCVAIFAAFNVVLELPYMAVLFWLLVGFLAAELLRPDESAATQDAVAVRRGPLQTKRYAVRRASS